MRYIRPHHFDEIVDHLGEPHKVGIRVQWPEDYNPIKSRISLLMGENAIPESRHPIAIRDVSSDRLKEFYRLSVEPSPRGVAPNDGKIHSVYLNPSGKLIGVSYIPSGMWFPDDWVVAAYFNFAMWRIREDEGEKENYMGTVVVTPDLVEIARYGNIRKLDDLVNLLMKHNLPFNSAPPHTRDKSNLLLRLFEGLE